MKDAREIQEEIAALTVEQKAAANRALVPGISKQVRKDARLDFIYLSGQLEGLRQSLGDKQE